MNGDWWGLPGPSAFVENVANDLSSGTNVVLKLPKFTPEGIERVIRQLASDAVWVTVDVDAGTNPLIALFDEFIGSTDTPMNAANLVDADQFKGHLVWIEGATRATWPAWNSFLLEYSQAMQSLAYYERTALLIPLRGPDAVIDVGEESGLTAHQWGKSFNRFDAHYYCHSLMERRNLTVMKRRVAVAILAELSLWDPTVATMLASDGLHVLLEPEPILNEIRKSRGWDSSLFQQCTFDEAWAEGLAAVVDNRPQRHSAALCDQRGSSELRKRIWRAQLTSVMPFIEEVRQAATMVYEKYLQPPHVVGADNRTDLAELEIGQVAMQLAHETRVPSEHRMVFRRLHKVRNELAHLRLVGWDDFPDDYPQELDA